MRNKKPSGFIVLLVILLSNFQLAFGQQLTINGRLKTKSNVAVAYASVLLKDSKNKVVAFKSSGENGIFTLQLPKTAEADDLILEINHLGFKKVRQALIKGKTTYEILMEERPVTLAEVEVKSRPVITRQGDTLSYNVDSFAKNEDRSIGDVIKRLPGMEVSENGQIKFNGQNISNLYIDGDDLLEDNYAIGTKTIPYAMVKGIEVLQNHQPLKVLKNKVFSDKIAVNLVIKEEAKLKLTAQATIGAGLPKQYDEELNTILFNKKYKLLNVVKANNTGDDLRADFNGFNRSSYLSGMGNTRPKTLLSSGTIASPALPKKSYYFNHSGSVNANNLINYNNGLQLKSTLNVLLDNNQLSYNNQAEFYTESDTIRYREDQHLDNHPLLANASLNAQLNKESYFLNSSLRFSYSKETGNAILQNNGEELKQQLQHRIRDFENHLEYVPELKNKNILSINWYLNYFNQPQQLAIHPGINAAVFNAGKPFNSLNQQAETPTWFNRTTIGYRLTKGTIKQRYQAGILHELQELHSRLMLQQPDGQQTPNPVSQDNALHWDRKQFFIGGTYEYKQGNIESRLSVPLILQHIAYQDKGFRLNESKSRFFFNPNLQLRYGTNGEDYVSLNYAFTNKTGNINDVFRGAVLSNYRTLQANDAALQEQESHTIHLAYNFKRSIKLLFMNAGASYKKTKANSIASLLMSNNISQTVLLPLINEMNSVHLNGGISKYIFALGATANLNASWTLTHFNQLFNETLLPFNDRIFSLSPELEARLLDRISIRYSSKATWLNSSQSGKTGESPFLSHHVQQYDHSLSLSYSPYKNTFIRVNGRYQFSKRPLSRDVRYFFSDVHIGYKLKRWRTDVELDVSNLANIRAYESYNISSNRFNYDRYQLRGRMAVLKAIFNL